jgi:hypothetical protein
MAGLFAAGSVLSFAAAVRTAGGVMAALRATTIGTAIAQAFMTGLSGYGLAVIGLSLAAAGGAAYAISGMTGDEGGAGKSSTSAISSAVGSSKSVAGNSPMENYSKQKQSIASKEPPPAAMNDAFAPGGSTITTPQGGKMITSAQDSVIAAKDGGVLAEKLTEISSLLKEYLDKPVPVMLDGKKVNSELAKANRYNPFVA